MDEIERQIPNLRRLARALCGSNEKGDWLIVTILETLLSEPKLFENCQPTKAELLRLLMTTYWSFAENEAKMLLQAMEGLSEQDARWVAARHIREGTRAA